MVKLLRLEGLQGGSKVRGTKMLWFAGLEMQSEQGKGSLVLASLKGPQMFHKLLFPVTVPLGGMCVTGWHRITQPLFSAMDKQ